MSQAETYNSGGFSKNFPAQFAVWQQNPGCAIQAVRLEEDVLMGPLDGVYVSNQPSGQKGNQVDLISQEKTKKIKKKKKQLKKPLHIPKLPK